MTFDSTRANKQPSAWRLDESGRRLMLRMTHICVWVGIPLALISNWYLDAQIGSSWFLVLSLATYSISAYILILRGKHELAVDVFLWSMLAVVLLQCTLVNGIRTPIAVLTPVILMLCGWLRGARQTYVMCAVILLALTGMALLEQRIWPYENYRPAFAYWLIYAFGSVLGAILSVHIANNLRAQYQQVITTGDALQRQVSDAQASQEKFAALFRFTPVPVSVSLVNEGTVFDVNPAWERISGWSRDDVIGKTASDLGIWVTQEERVEWISAIRQNGHTNNLLTRFRQKNGEIREFLASGELVEYDGKSCVFASFVDITDQRNAEARLRELNAELETRVAQRTKMLEESNQNLGETVSLLQRTQAELVRSETLASLGALVAGVAHELNTPIGSAVLISSTLTEDVGKLRHELDGGALRKSALTRFVEDADIACNLLGTSLNRARDLVNSFKAVAMDQSSERRRSFDLAEVIEDVLDTLRPSFKHRPITLLSEMEPELRMDSYPGPVGQVLSNLVQNALMHGLDRPEGGTITVSCQALDADRARIVVSDDGAGISDDNLSRIFDPFFTTRLESGGNGLGLSIIHGLVNTTLGGSITVSSQEGRGTRFSVVLPRSAPTQT